jgi:DNA-binding NarL/FixJ family response regulator
MKIKIGIVDDHQLFLKSLSTLVNTFESFEVVVEALNGKALLQKLQQINVKPDILLIDLNMPVMDGVQTATAVAEEQPQIKTVALSMKDDDTSIIRMLQAGCCAYLLKDIHPNELEKALLEINNNGYYNADAINVNYRRLIIKAHQEQELQLSTNEKKFLQLACSDLTYKQIASKMNLSERTIDGYRESLFQKLNVQSRVGMALEAIRRKLVSID